MGLGVACVGNLVYNIKLKRMTIRVFCRKEG